MVQIKSWMWFYLMEILAPTEVPSPLVTSVVLLIFLNLMISHERRNDGNWSQMQKNQWLPNVLHFTINESTVPLFIGLVYFIGVSAIFFNFNVSIKIIGSNWVSNCCLMPSEQYFSHIMARTSYISIKWWWWCSLCTRPTR